MRKTRTTVPTKTGKNERTAKGVLTIPNTLRDSSHTDGAREETAPQI